MAPVFGLGAATGAVPAVKILFGQRPHLELANDMARSQFLDQPVFELDAAGDKLIPVRRRRGLDGFDFLGLFDWLWVLGAMCRHFGLVI